MAQLNVEVIVGLVNRLSGGLRGISRDLRRTSRDISITGAGMRYGGQQILAPLRGAAQAAIDLESAMADVRKVVDFETPDGLAVLTDELESLSRTIPLTASQLAEIAAAGGQLGIQARDLRGYTETVAKMATAFDLLPGVAGESMAKLSNVYQIPIASIGLLGDAINHLSNNTAAKASEIVEATGRVGGTARQFGLTAVQASALTGAMIALGKTPEVAATGINAMLVKLQTATKQGEKFQRGLSAINVDAAALEQSISRDAQGALTELLETLSALDQQSRAGVLADLFGLEYADDISLLAGSLDQYRAALALVGDEANYAGSMQNEFAARSDTTANKLQLLGNRAAEFQRSVGGALTPVLSDLMGRLTPILDRVGGWIDRNRELAGTITLIVAGFGAVMLVLGPLVMAFGALAAGAAWIAGAFAAMTAPIWLTVAAIAAVVAGFLYFRDDIVLWVVDAAELIVATFKTLPGALLQIGRDLIDGLWQGILERWNALKAKIGELAQSLPAWMRDKLGIRSPSRVFMAIGEDSMRGLEAGLAARARYPLAQIRDMAAGLTLGAAVVASPASAAVGPSATRGGPISMPISITINAPAGADARAIADLVRREVAGATRQAAGRIAALYDGSDNL